MTMNKPRLMIAGAGSGVGKTTICCSILKAFSALDYKVVAFKSGPDYIDPMFHTQVLGIPSRNLDLFMLKEETVKYLLKENTKAADIAIIEGAMGFYDGISHTSTASAYHLSQVTKTPVVLVISCKGMARSVAAIVKGYLELEKNLIKGIILNNVSEAMAGFYKEIIEKETGVKVVGYLPPMPECQLGSRHLGLVTPEAISNLQEMLQTLASKTLDTIDFKMLMEIASSAQPLEVENIELAPFKESVRIAVAKDEAFNFYYEDNFKLLKELGATLIPFSPLRDNHLPENIDGMLIGGGYPELHMEALEKNKSLKKEIKNFLQEGMPCIAECGGFMYLQKYLLDENNVSHKMVGYLQGKAWMTKRLNRFGYIQLTAQKDNMLAKAGGCIPAHEFHYSDCDYNGDSFIATKPMKDKSWRCAITSDVFYAGYPHLHLWSDLNIAKSYLEACIIFKNKRLGE